MFEGRYTLWGGEHSFFTRKLQAMLNYLDLSYEFRLKSTDAGPGVEARLGTHFIPGLETPEGWFVHDTTPIGLMLNAKYPDRPILPSTPVQRIAAHLWKTGQMSGSVGMRSVAAGAIPTILPMWRRAFMRIKRANLLHKA